MTPLPSHSDLLEALTLDGMALERVVRLRESYYTRRTIKRRPGARPRRVYEVKGSLRRIHRVIAMMLEEDLKDMHACVTGFRKKHTIKHNARPHCMAEFVAVADVFRFFGSITHAMVWKLFCDLGASTNVAMTLAYLTTLDDVLPEGSRCSPAIANLVGRKIDDAVHRQLGSDCAYTRYVDDLSFSGTSVPTNNDVEGWLEEAGFTMKPGSYVMRRRCQGPYVTGLFVGDSSPKIPRSRRRMIERTLYYLSKSGKARALSEMRARASWRNRSETSQMRGLTSLIDSVASVDEELARKYYRMLAIALGQAAHTNRDTDSG